MNNEIHPLTNSRRRFEKLTYTPLILEPPLENEPTGVLWLSALTRALMISDSEFTMLEQQVQDQSQKAALNAMESLAKAVSGPGVLAAAGTLAAVPAGGLVGVAKALGSIRKQAADSLAAGLRDLDARFLAAVAAAAPVAPPIAQVAAPAAPQRPVEQPSAVALALAPFALSGESKLIGKLDVAASSVAGAETAAQTLLAGALGTEIAARASEVISWATVNAPQQLAVMRDTISHYLPSGLNLSTIGSSLDSGSQADSGLILSALILFNRLGWLTQLFLDALTRRPLQPLGLLHLERLLMTPLGVEQGELLYSLALAPNEKVTLAHKEWTVHEEQFTQFIQDFMENFSEKGVSQSDDIAMSTSAETSHKNVVQMNQPVASPQSVGTTSPVDTTQSPTSSVEDTTTQEQSKEQTRTVTAQASARTIRDQKTSFTVTTVSGMTDFTSHLIENKHDDKSMRIDYFRRVRKWQSDLYRYGVRLAYDVVLPDPGTKLRRREKELGEIADQLATEFNLNLTPSEITPNNWETLADTYGVLLPPPPDQSRQIEVSQSVGYPTPYDTTSTGDGSSFKEDLRQVTLQLTIPDNFELSSDPTSLTVYAEVAMWIVTNPFGAGYGDIQQVIAGDMTFSNAVPAVPADNNGNCLLNWPLSPPQVPATGQLAVAFLMHSPNQGVLKLTANVVPTEAAMETWRLRCWQAIRDASLAKWAQHQGYLRNRQSALLKDIASDDSLRLRRLEREQIMLSVLEWLFPGFDDASSILANLPSPGSLDPGDWQHVMEYGEYIKFVQTAIDWDNILVYLYPYFWDSIWHEKEKLFLNHPDPIHREFLRAGAARVIIPIQPGFEDQVVMLLDQGQLGKLPNQSRFAKVVKDVQDANDKYEQTAQGGGADENPKEPGVLIGAWTDYTPTGALDIQVTLANVVTS